MKTNFIILLFILGSNFIFGQDTSALNKRPSFNLDLYVNDTVFYEAPIAESFYVINDSMIQIFPGENLYFEATQNHGKLDKLKRVASVTDSSKTLIIEFKQVYKGKTHEQMILSVRNPFKKNLHYKAFMNLMKNKKWAKTSVVPVIAGLISYETWPNIITSLMLKGFELKD